MSYEAGSVTAKIQLDTKDFDAKIKSLQGKIDDLKIHLQKNGLQDVSKQVEQFKKELDSSKTAIDNLKRVNEQYKKTISSLKQELKEVSKEHKNIQTSLDTETNSLDNNVKKTKVKVEAEKQVTKAIKDEIKAEKELEKIISRNVTKSKHPSYSTKHGSKYRLIEYPENIASDIQQAINKEAFEYLNKRIKKGDWATLQATKDFDPFPLEDLLPVEDLRNHIKKTFGDALYKGLPSDWQGKMQKALGISLNYTGENFQVDKIKKPVDSANISLEKLKKTVDSTKTEAEKFDEAWRNTSYSFKRSATEIDKAIEKFAPSDISKSSNEFEKLATESKKASEVVKSSSENSAKSILDETKAVEQAINKFKEEELVVKKLEATLKKAVISDFDSLAKYEFATNRKQGKNGAKPYINVEDIFRKLNTKYNLGFTNDDMVNFLLDNSKFSKLLQKGQFSGKGFNQMTKFTLNDLRVAGRQTKLQFEEVNTSIKTTDKLLSNLKRNSRLKNGNFEVGFKKISQESRKATSETTKLNNEIKKTGESVKSSADSSVKGSSKEVTATEKSIKSLKDKELEVKKVDEAITQLMRKEASSYLQNLKFVRGQGGLSTDLIGTDQMFSRNYKEIGWTRIFDIDRLLKHLHSVFDGILSPEQFKEQWRKLSSDFGIGLMGTNVSDGVGGIRSSQFKELKASVTETTITMEQLKEMVRQVEAESNRFVEEFLRGFAEIGVGAQKTEAEILKVISAYDGSGERILPTRAILKGFSELQIGAIRTGEEIEKAISKFADTGKSLSTTEEFRWALRGIANTIKGVNTEFNRFEAESNKVISELSKTAVINENWNKINYTFEKTQGRLEYVTTGFNKLTGQTVRTTEVLKTFNFALLEGVEKETIFYQRTVALASAMQRMNSQGTKNWAGRGQFGYSQYIAQITQMNRAMEKQRQIQQTIKQQRLDQYYAKVNSATQKYWTQIREGTINLNTYKSKITEINRALQQQTQRTQRLATAQYKLFQKYHTTNLNTYKANMSAINAELEKQTTNTAKADANTRKLGKGLTSFNNGVVQTAHSGRILSNTLYQIRGALLSLKMIFTAMGGMALWGFAMEIAEGVKTTFQAKNEMEAQLKQNSKVSQGGIEYFNRELTELTKNYKKVNKYSIGETVSSVGLEFDLSAEQMKKALPIVTMIQSEYVRAGRKTEEASLAVKDILQGEFQRLSRETGVGKEELIAYGWDEDKENIDGLLDALKKAGLARHWDIFAKKATSLNDVLTITKSRFEETGADILDSASPAIVEGFNMIIGAIDGVQKAFNGMNAFWRNIAWFGGGTAFFGGLATLLPVITKGMGLADIATIGWSKSIGTAVFNLNKAEVAQYGFRKALTAVIAGTKASEIANVRWTKSIMGRVLGVKQGTLAEKGYLTALVEHKMSLKGLTPIMDKAGISSLKWYQKLGYLSGGLKESEVATAGLGRSLLKTATSAKVLRFALVGITGIALVAWLSAVGTQADLVKKRIQAFNEIVETGAEKLKETQSQIDAYQKTVDKYQNSTNKDEQNRAKIAKANIDILEGNKKELQLANRLAQSYKKQNEEREKSITLAQSTFRKNALIKAGHTEAEATEKQAFWVDKINQAQYEITNSYNKQYDWLESSEKHINEKVTLMKKEADLQKSQIKDAKEAEAFEKNALKLRDKYIMEYATVAEEAGEHLKQFYQGDIMAGAYFLLDQFKLRWIDLWYDEHFVNFWKSLQQTWESLKPVVYGLKDALQGLGDSLLDFLSTDIGQATLVFSGLGVAIGGIGLKIAKWVSGSGSVFDVLKKLPSKLKKVAGGWKDVADKAEDASKKTGGATSTGGIAGDVSEGKMSLKEGMLSDLKGNVRKYANYATQLAFMMGLITEAILLIQAPMWALAETGKTFKAKEKSIRAGIEGLQVVAPTILAILVPVVALMKVFDKFGDVFTKSSAKTIGSAVVGIAVGLGLVAETILMIIPSLWALGALGDQLSGMESQVKKGTEAMKIVSESLYYLLPFIPALAGGILLGIAMFESGGLGALLTVAVAGGIAIGLGLVAETIYLLQAPLWAIGEIGNNFKDLSNVKRGAEAIKLTGEALTYVEEGMRSLVLIQWEVLAGYIAKLIGINIGADLTNLTDEGGFFDQLEQFTTQFNQLELTPINPDKVTVLNGISTGLSTVGTALQNAKTAIDNIPAELKNGGVNLNYDMQTDTTSIQSGEATSYFEQLKEPLKQLGEFITWFNSEELQIPAEGVNADKLQAINDSATMLQSVNDAVTKVRDVMGNSLLTEGLATANGGGSVAFGGIGSIVNFGTELGASIMGGGSGTGSYKSTLGSSFQQMEDIISDLSTFSTNISSYTMGEGGDTQSGNLESLTTFVQGVSTQISTLVSTLNSKVPEAKQNAESLGKGIIDGIKSGLKGIEQVGTYITTTVANSIMLSKDTTYNTANSLGKTTASKFKDGVDPMSDYMTWEMFYVGKAMDDQKESLGQKAYDLGSYIASKFKEGDDINSPGIMARSMQSELSYIAGYLSTSNLPQLAFDLANLLSSNFKLDFNLGNFQLPDMTQWTSQLSTVVPTVSGIKTQVSTNFNAMKTNVQNSFSGIVSKTQTSMSAMKTSTLSHIGNIKTSWRGMQDALIASAENIKAQTGSKINTLKTNLGDFWNKVKHPDQLIGSVAGGHKGTIRRRYAPTLKSSRGHYAGGGTGGLFKPKRSTSRSPDDDVMEYIRCVLKKGDQCYAGGWNFNWTKSISDKFKGWNTHFNAYSLDKYLNVGKFENSNFPVKGNAQVAKDYIFDVISATSYAKYFDSKFGNNPVSALRAGAFNCWDGTQIVLALARAFGFSGSIGHGTWNGVGHVWANIAGLGIIDPTAIQQRGAFTSSAVKGYSAGAMPRRYASDKNLPSGNNTTNHNEVHIHIEGDVYGVDDLNSKIEEGANRVARQLFRNSYSGV